jgi:dihydrodipicolinate synthase/N-acetylneuraminate lyase
MLNDTVLRLCEVPNIVGIKDATGNLERGQGDASPAVRRPSCSTAAMTPLPSS